MNDSHMMTPVAQWIRKLLEDQGLRISDLIERTGLPRPTVSRHVNGRTVPSYADRRRYAAAFGLAMEAFEQGWRGQRIDVSRPEGSGVIPVINRAPAGLAVNYEETGIDSGVGLEYIDRGDLADGNLFAVIVVGRSMQPTLLEGDYAVFQPVDRYRAGRLPKDGEVVFVRFGPDAGREGCLIARWFATEGDAGRVRLQKDNPRFSAIECGLSDLDQLATLVEFRRKASELGVAGT